jgi:hypothetical protein
LKRAEIAREALLSKRNGASLVERLQGNYRIKIYRFASSAREDELKQWLAKKDESKPSSAGVSKEPDSGDTGFRKSTDIAEALERALQDVEAGGLAGILLLTDGQHNGPSGVDAVAGRIAGDKTPICSVVIGSLVAPRDAAITDVKAPESIFHGDKLVIAAKLKLNGMAGTSVKARLLCRGVVVQERIIDVLDGARQTTEVRFAHTPAEAGLFEYSVEIAPIDGEWSQDNNKWAFEVAVSTDRLNVLLLDDRPRWEFRYLRNLFFGRDKSVHLQYVLFSPDVVAGSPALPATAASVYRKFGDAEATRLPASEDEWKRFDVIILGDIPAQTLGDHTLDMIKRCVADRGALLIAVAGSHYMPHSYENQGFMDMLPVQYVPHAGEEKGPQEAAYRLALTPDGRNHMVTQQSPGFSENLRIWDSLPELYWRHTGLKAKTGGTVLAFAMPVAQQKGSPADSLSGEENSRDTALARQISAWKDNPLVVAHNYGRGRVLMQTFDEMWRLRYRMGDTYHHKFWTQALRWGMPERMRSGNELVRLGTDKTVYSPGEAVHVTARVWKEGFVPVNNGSAAVGVFLNDALVLRQKLDYRNDSNGIYESILKLAGQSGRYRIELEGRDVIAVLAGAQKGKISTEFVIAARTSAELSELEADPGILLAMASASRGEVVSPENAEKLTNAFGPGNRTIVDRSETTLWDSVYLWLMIAGCLTAEWILRKTGGLP